MKKIFLLLACGLFLFGCAQQESTIHDQCLRAKLFQKCLSTVPPGPNNTRYNDWDEVVDSCESAASFQSYRKTSSVKPECRP